MLTVHDAVNAKALEAALRTLQEEPSQATQPLAHLHARSSWLVALNLNAEVKACLRLPIQGKRQLQISALKYTKDAEQGQGEPRGRTCPNGK